MKYKIHLELKDEQGNYILDAIGDNGFLLKRDSVTKEELPELMKELSTMSGDDKNLQRFRDCYQLYGLKAVTLKERKNEK